MSDLVDRFADLFAGRKDAWGSTHGECIKEPVTCLHYERHLTVPTRSIGIYPLIQDRDLALRWGQTLKGPVGDNFVKWGCSDIDNDNVALAVNLKAALGALGIKAWVERTKSGHYHVWVFADEWVPALVMRRTLLVAHQVAGVAPTEVNPKQLDVGVRVKYGNYVNLPYPCGWEASSRRCVIDRSGGVILLDEFVDLASGQRTSFETLRAAGKHYREPVKPAVVVDRQSTLTDELLRELPGLAWTIYKDGPLEGRDRSGTLQRLAFLCAEAGMKPADTLAVVTSADARWGKYLHRPDGERQLNAIVTYAYSKVAS